MKESLQTLQDTLIAHVHARSIEGTITTIEKLLTQTRSDPADREAEPFKTFAGVISAASQVCIASHPDDYIIQSLLLSGLMGTEHFGKRVVHLRLDLENQARRERAAASIAKRSFNSAETA